MTVRPILHIVKKSVFAAAVFRRFMSDEFHRDWCKWNRFSELSPQRAFWCYVRILSWNMIDFYILRNVKNVMFHYMPVVTLNNIGDEIVRCKLNFNRSRGWWFLPVNIFSNPFWVYSDDVSNFSSCCNFGFKLQVKHCGKCHRNDMASAKTHVFNSSQHLTCQSIHESKHEQIRNHQHHVHFQIFRPTHS